MAWIVPSQGVSPAEAAAGFHFSAPSIPAYQSNQEKFAQAANEAAQTIAAILKQRERDQIANQLLAVNSAPQAQSVDGTVRGTGQPDTELNDAMVQQNLRLGAPTQPGKVPDLGGYDALKMRQELLGDQAELSLKQAQADYYRNRGEAAITKANQPSRGSGVSGFYEDDNPKEPDVWTAPNGAQYVRGPRGGLTLLKQPKPEKPPAVEQTPEVIAATKLKKQYGLDPSDLQNMQNFELVDDRGNPVVDTSTDPNAANVVKPDKAYFSADTPHGHLMALRSRIGPLMQTLKNVQSAPPVAVSGQDSVARAQQALNDPEATPAEKAQAQKILAAYGQ